MFPFDPSQLPAMPAPYWFVQFFKVLGFVLHILAMHLWMAGLPIALIAFRKAGPEGQVFAKRFLRQLPIVLAMGINFGIVPLLFLQTAYYKQFYTATILMAWHWLAIIDLVILGYIAVYYCAFSVISDNPKRVKRAVTVGIVASAALLLSGFFFANGLTLMVNPEKWTAIASEQSVAGAVSGFGLNVTDPTLLPRFSLMFGLAILSTAMWIVFDAAFFYRKKGEQPEGEDYRRWALDFAVKVVRVGVIWTVVSGTIYLLATWPQDVREVMFSLPMAILTLLTGLSPFLPLLVLEKWKNQPLDRHIALMMVLGQVVVLSLNSISRQVVQNIGAARSLDISELSVSVQWSPLILFLIIFLLAAGVIAWMLKQVVDCHREGVSPEPVNPK
jgi:hypothetical protein